MNRKSLETAAIVAFYTIVFIYIVACTFYTIENLSILGATMIFKPAFPSIIDMVRDERRYGESDRMRNYAGLHTPAYRVLNHVSKALLDAKLYSACTVMNSRSQYKHISYKTLFSVTIAYGYSAVYIGACRIFAVDEWTRTIYHVDSNGMMNVTPYHQDYDMTDVIAQVSECIEVLKECYKPVADEPVEQTRWAIKRVIKDRPYHGPIKGATWSVKATLLASSKNLIHWKVEWYDMDNPSRTRIESGVWAKAYKHSLLGEMYSSPWAGSRVARPTATIDVPEWWYQKNILVAYPA
jgi:hypothetical protein